MLQRYWQFTKGRRLLVFLCPLTVIAEVILELQIPRLIALLINNGIMMENWGYVYDICLRMFVISVLSLAFGAASVRLTALTAMHFGKNIRAALYNKIQALSQSSLDRFGAASLLMRMTADTNSMQTAFMMVIRVLCRAPALFVVSLYMIMTMNSRLALIVACSAPILIAIFYVVSRLSYPRHVSMRAKGDALNERVRENLELIKTVKVYGGEDYEASRFEKSNKELYTQSVAADRLIVMNGPALSLVMYTVTVIVLWFGAQHVIDGFMLTGDLIIYITYITQMLVAINMVSVTLVNVIMCNVSARRIGEVLDEKSEAEKLQIAEDAFVYEAADSGSKIDFCNISFRYEGTKRNALTNIDLHIKSGELIGIIGSTGSGKSTLVNLLPRLYEPDEGQLKIDDRDIKAYDLESLRSGIGFVSQKPMLFAASVEENLRMGNDALTDDELHNALQTACAYDFVMQKGGLKAAAGQGGAGFSGGEVQRLCIARALLKKPALLILDDSLSALDAITSAKVQENIIAQRAGRTTIIIAQKISTVAACDRIVVMENGSICGIGTHEELLESNGIYREICHSQQGGDDR
ncbi:MAG: ABC transporter ATP-binding protein [Firmicutes bacterium]|nr:ABC transporter ATP-binding protein [Bacillota bacterium]